MEKIHDEALRREIKGSSLNVSTQSSWGGKALAMIEQSLLERNVSRYRKQAHL